MTVWCAGWNETGSVRLRWEWSGEYPNLNLAKPDSSKCAHQTVIYIEWHIPDVVLIQLIVLMIGTWLPVTGRE
jgi:hypothetical protein